jgi:hypothetical protein
MQLLYAGFDTVDVAFAGALPSSTLEILSAAREEAQTHQSETLVEMANNCSAHVASHGMRGGYAFLIDTGPVGFKWFIKNNTNPTQWNIFCRPHAATLLSLGYHTATASMLAELSLFGATITDHSVNRIDYAIDFSIPDFKLDPRLFVSHARSKLKCHWGISVPESHILGCSNSISRGREVESVTIGKQPGRQIIIYNKLREVLEKRKFFWLKTWNLNEQDSARSVWRVEIRAGKSELKEKHNIRRFADVENSIGDVIQNTLSDIRYLRDFQSDTNVTRQILHPLWEECLSVTKLRLFEHRSGLTRGQIVEIERAVAMERYLSMTIGNAIGYGVSTGLDDDAIISSIGAAISDAMKDKIIKNRAAISDSINRARKRLHFLI